MKRTMKTKLAAVSLVLGMGTAGATSGMTCEEWAYGARISYCASNGGGSACASSPGLYNWLVQECKRNNYCG